MAEHVPTATDLKIAEVEAVCRAYGKKSIIALAGVPGTGKSHIGVRVAQNIASDPLLVREIQFHPTYSYEEFIEGYRANTTGGFSVEKGVFLEWNQQALDDPGKQYVLLIEELTHANLPAVLGELMTYVEYRKRPFTTLYSKRPVRVAENLTIIATYNPRDRSALELDNALLRRLRVIEFPPDTDQLLEMLPATIPATVKSKLSAIFTACKAEREEDYPALMPFGHGIFSEVKQESPDLHDLWHQRLRHLLEPPARQADPFRDVIADNYPWRNDKRYVIPQPPAVTTGAEAQQAELTATSQG